MKIEPPPSLSTITPLKKITSLFSSNPPLKVKDLSSPPLFENLVGGSSPPPAERGVGGGGCTLCKWISRCENFGHKKVVLFPEYRQAKKFLSLVRQCSQMYIRTYVFHLKKQANKQTKKNTKKAKETKEEKRIYLKNR